ncbi:MULTISPECIES: enoyl-CoA hydratase [unclassified Bacillus (in: firmicutes)]|uniref:enoyl-CoA hydratase n=1 Tax=unclassified Bacillus (in: firmicutes) TaxID=185979 RepID=UPI00080AF59B|nr:MULTISPECIES: enoyl-CoA hydratase [unclassified Bacillus (in: firmicutes)]OCA86913.1 enoyl-CoA hydratase [Bacillus sp. FJAT-27986]
MIKQSIREDGVAVIVLDQPQKSNALSIEMLKELQQTLRLYKENSSIHCIIITGSGDKAFCSGADLKERLNMTPAQVGEAVRLIKETISMIDQMPQPTIASINGAAFGGGLELALACDIRVASHHAKMGLTETSLGIIPGAGGTQRLPRLIGISKAKELIFTARRIDAIEALQIGLVNQIAKPDELETMSLSIARKIAANAPIAVKEAKKAIERGMETDLVHGLQIEEMSYQVTIPTKDRMEGLIAFKEKRKPVYTGE